MGERVGGVQMDIDPAIGILCEHEILREGLGRILVGQGFRLICCSSSLQDFLNDEPALDLIIVDECHRGSARDDSSWRVILEYFESAFQLGMTATPLRQDNRDTYLYFGNPLYQYSLRQGIEDGFLAP